jgi:hypothetical protein
MARSDGDVEHRVRLLAAHTERLQTLEIQAAQHGRDCPAHITNEINALRKDIAELNALAEPAIDQIRHPFIRGFLERAAEYNRAANYAEAAGTALGGLLWALRMVEPALIGRQISTMTDRTAITTQRMMLFNALGLDYPEYFDISERVGVVQLMQRGVNIHVDQIGGTFEVGADTAARAIAFCTSAIRRIETRAGDLGQPFGRHGIKL